MLEAVDPATGALIRRYPEMSEPDVRAVLERADGAFETWRRTDFAERGRAMTARRRART